MPTVGGLVNVSIHPVGLVKAPRRRLILFDVDHTLVDVLRFHEPAYAAAVRAHHGVEVRLRDIQFAGKTTPNILRELCAHAAIDQEAREASVPAMLQSFRQVLLDGLPGRLDADVLPGVVPLLHCLSERGHVLGIVTGNPPEIGRTVLTRAGLLDRFTVFAFGTEAAERAQVVALAINRGRRALGGACSPHDVIVVGDTPHDVRAGRANGTLTVAVGTGLHTRAELEAAAPDLIVPDFGAHAAVCEALSTLGASPRCPGRRA